MAKKTEDTKVERLLMLLMNKKLITMGDAGWVRGGDEAQ